MPSMKVEPCAATLVYYMRGMDWSRRHSYWAFLCRHSPHKLLADVKRVMSPDELIDGQNTGAMAMAIVPLPLPPYSRYKQLTLHCFFSTKKKVAKK